MFKITIDNEEVITDKDFTIEEEMLNTPSVILNNVYPKEWETEKDYLNFYHPNEYSKCKIYDEEITPASEGSTVEGTDFSITYDDTKEFSLLSLKGETSQETTTGKNLLANDLATRTENGITITKNTDGTYKVNGTATADISLAINNDFVAMSGTWRMLGCPAGGSASTYMLSAYVGYWGGGSPNIDTGNGTNITYTGNVKVRFYIKSGTTCNNLIFKPMLTTDTSTTINNWERYTGGIASPNPNYPQEVQTVSGRQEVEIVGKNLNFTPYANGTTKTTNGITFTVQNDGTIVANGTATATAYFYMHTQDITPYWNLPKGNYILSGCASGGASNKYYIGMAVYNDTTRITGVNEYGSGANFNTTSLTYNRVLLFISISSGQVCNNLTFKPMVRLANISDSTYEEYKGQTYELDLGKNMLSLTNNQTITSAGITAQVQHGWIILNGTATAISTIRLTIEPITVYGNKAYTLSANNTSQVSGSGIILSVGSTADSYTQTNFSSVNAKRTFKKDSATTYNRLTISTASGTTYHNYIIKPQLEKGTKATKYSEYKEPIELCKIGSHQDRILKNTGLNLYDKDAGNILNAYFNASQTTIANNSANRMIYIPCKPNTTYTLSKIRSAQFNIGYTKELPAENVQVYGINTSPTFYNDNSWYYFTITTPADAQYIVSRIYQTAQDTTITLDQVLGTIQLEEGNTPSDYQPFGSGSWYLYKAINKAVLDGSETWVYDSQYNYFRCPTYNFENGIPLEMTSANKSSYNQYCSHFTINKNWSGAGSFRDSTTTQGIFYPLQNTGYKVIFRNTDYTTATSFQNWLSSNNVSVYYELAVPTTEIIEDTDLLKQLDAISLLNGINYITVSSPNLVAPLKIHYNFNEEVIDQELYFCGVVKNSGNISLNPREPHFQSLQVLSYKTFLSEGETLDFVIYEKTIREAIEQVVSAISDYGFIVGDINILNPDEIIGAYSTKDKSAYDVFQYIADITQSRWTTRMIDEDTIAIDFYDPTLMELGTTIDYTKEFFEENLIDNMFYSYGTNDYRNKQVMTSQQVYSNINQTQNIVANGYQTQFNTEQNIGKINSILVDNVSYSFATNTEKEMGVSADFYYSAGNNYIESASTIPVGRVITIDYLPIVEGRQIITNAYEIDRVANSTGVKGVVARYENRNDATTSAELQLIGQSYIKYKGTPEIILTVVSRKDLWNVGQRVPFNAPIDELATEYMVRKKAINRITTIDTIFYTYELTSSFNSETAVNYFDNQRAKANGNIGDGEYISRNIDIESQARIVFYGSSATVITTTGDNKLNCALESPFVE